MANANTARLRLVLNTWTICNLPRFSAFPAGLDEADTVAFIRQAGYEGLQMETDDPLIAAGLAAGMHMSATGRVITPEAAMPLCQTHKDMGFSLTTLHVGTGFEDQVTGLRLMDSVLNASARTGYPLYVETHRATLTQDPRRTLDFLAVFPELYLNGDFSHWYAGCEMPYGDFEEKLAALQPVFDNVRYLHGRMADSSCMQVLVAGPEATNSRHFSDMWRRSFAAFLGAVDEREAICFAPELLPNSAELNGRHVEINYARMKFSLKGPIEETDRWSEGLRLCGMAKSAFQQARQVHVTQTAN